METPHSELHTPHSHPACAALKADGQPCRARPIPSTDYCPFHHPDHAPAFAEGRSQGGAAPRRRVRRLPLILDHLHVAEFLSELMVEIMNSPDGADLRRLQALTQAARVHLKAVGAPRGCFFFHFDRRETPAHLPHLRRYDPPAPDPALAPDPSDPPAAEPGPLGRHPEAEALLGPALRTLQLYPREEAARQPILWLEPDSSVDAEPWTSAAARLAAAAPAAGGLPAPDVPEPPATEESASTAGDTRSGPSRTAGGEPVPPESASFGSVGPPLPEPGSLGITNPTPAPTASVPAAHPPSGQALDKRWTSAPATSGLIAGDDLDGCPLTHSREDAGAPTPPIADEPPLPSPSASAQPAFDEPAPPPRRPCIALFSPRPTPGSRPPWPW